jgi:hypothetical protein
MKIVSKSNAVAPVYQELASHVRSIKVLLNELEPSERLRYMNELFVSLLPERTTTESAQDKIISRLRSTNATSQLTLNALSKEQQRLINKLTSNTDRLHREMNDDSI